MSIKWPWNKSYEKIGKIQQEEKTGLLRIHEILASSCWKESKTNWWTNFESNYN